jgi:hypothetical protein
LQLLMARPDGSFYLQPADFNDAFAMAVALPDAQTGEPLDNSLQAFIFRNGWISSFIQPFPNIFRQAKLFGWRPVSGTACQFPWPARSRLCSRKWWQQRTPIWWPT